MIRGLIGLAESGLVPDEATRLEIRFLNRKSLRLEEAGSTEDRQGEKNRFIDDLRQSPIVLQPEKPNEQHYELPPKFFQQIMGRWMKYICGFYTDSVRTLDEAEEAMLELTCRRAKIADGQTIMDVWCGWAV
ncbi:MAG: class I SAM-dependent methyltransferase [Syntrophales bacterium LBB04]|nr:class I SAM-dependent methyltransferase [Syntrophales bacterium LBB04]